MKKLKIAIFFLFVTIVSNNGFGQKIFNIKNLESTIIEPYKCVWGGYDSFKNQYKYDSVGTATVKLNVYSNMIITTDPYNTIYYFDNSLGETKENDSLKIKKWMSKDDKDTRCRVSLVLNKITEETYYKVDYADFSIIYLFKLNNNE